MNIVEKLETLKDFDICSGILEVLFGPKIGEGLHRDVYEYALDKKYVIKIEKESDSLANYKEFLFWAQAQYVPEMKKWLCPIKEMSTNGRILIMQKMTPITEKNKHKIPKEIPIWLSDMKWANYGFIGNQFVCCDYSFSADYSLSNSKTKMKKWKSHLGEK